VRAEWDRSQPEDPLRIFVNDRRIDDERSGGSWPLPDDPMHMNFFYIGAGNATGDFDIIGTIMDPHQYAHELSWGVAHP
jgi:hypothetical protein